VTRIIAALKDSERRPVAFFLCVTAACAVSIALSSLWQWIAPALAVVQ